MTEPAYSLTQIVPDGALTGPRWLLHCVKIAQHTAPAFGLWCLLGDPVLAATIAGPVLYCYILALKLWHRHRPNWLDWLHDGALSMVPVAGAFVAIHDPRGWLLLALCALTWLGLHRYAIP